MNLSLKRISFLAVLLSALIGIGCSESAPPAAKKEPEPPAEAISGESALYKMYQAARASWSPDAKVLKLNSIHVADVPETPGKTGAWQATFTSDKLGKSRTYTYSVVEQEGTLHKGVYGIGDEAWSGRSGANIAFDIRSASVDSTTAYKTADEQAKDYDQKHPGMAISFLLEQTPQFTTPAWRVIWGDSVGTSAFSVYVDASQGKFLSKMH
jgi:hypothetical protein